MFEKNLRFTTETNVFFESSTFHVLVVFQPHENVYLICKNSKRPTARPNGFEYKVKTQAKDYQILNI